MSTVIDLAESDVMTMKTWSPIGMGEILLDGEVSGGWDTVGDLA